jgi:hypothetical protein
MVPWSQHAHPAPSSYNFRPILLNCLPVPIHTDGEFPVISVLPKAAPSFQHQPEPASTTT